jgi:SOS-response transcriptional repressor LexA
MSSIGTQRIEIARRIEEFMRFKGWKKAEFARRMDIMPQNVNLYLSGKLDPQNLFISLEREGGDVEHLLTGKTKETEIASQTVFVPFLGRIVAGLDGKESFDYSDVPAHAGVPFYKGNFFALEIQNTALLHARNENVDGLYPGDVCIFESLKRPRNGDIVAVQFKQNNERTVRLYKQVAPAIVELHPSNRYQNFPVRKVRDAEVRSYGVCVAKLAINGEMKKRFGLKK